jgi:hypothetical protein
MKMWNENMRPGIITDLINNVNRQKKSELMRKISLNNSNTDDSVYLCDKCSRLWEWDWRRNFHGPKKHLYVPSCNAITKGKEKEICPKCK